MDIKRYSCYFKDPVIELDQYLISENKDLLFVEKIKRIQTVVEEKRNFLNKELKKLEKTLKVINEFKNIQPYMFI